MSLVAPEGEGPAHPPIPNRPESAELSIREDKTPVSPLAGYRTVPHGLGVTRTRPTGSFSGLLGTTPRRRYSTPGLGRFPPATHDPTITPAMQVVTLPKE